MSTFKILLGILEMCFLPALIIIRSVLGFQAGTIHWLIAGSFFGLGIYNIRQALATKKKKTENGSNIPATAVVSNETKQSRAYHFILNSYENWRTGYFDAFSDYYKKAATKDSPEVLTGILLNETSYKNFLDICFEVRLPETDEIMYTISPNDFIITSKTLYINTSLKEGDLHAIPLCDITEYQNKGIWTKSGVMKLKSGLEIQFKLNAVPDEKKLRQLQEMLGCSQLMSI